MHILTFPLTTLEAQSESEGRLVSLNKNKYKEGSRILPPKPLMGGGLKIGKSLEEEIDSNLAS